jgi:hypothetical protein
MKNSLNIRIIFLLFICLSQLVLATEEELISLLPQPPSLLAEVPLSRSTAVNNIDESNTDHEFDNYDSDEEVFSVNPAAKELPKRLSKVMEIVRNPNDDLAYKASLFIMKSGKSTKRQKDSALEIITKISEDFEHEQAAGAIKYLISNSNSETEKEALKARVIEMAQSDHKCNMVAAALLISLALDAVHSASITEREFIIGQSTCERIICDKNHEKRALAASLLKSFGNPNQKKVARNVFVEIAQDIQHKDRIDAAKELYDPDFANLLRPPCSDRRAAIMTGISCCCCMPCYCTCFLPYKLYNCLNFPKRRRLFLSVKAIHDIALDATHERAYDAAAFIAETGYNLLCHNRSFLNQEIAQHTLRSIADIKDHPHQRDAIDLLRESNNPEDQQIGTDMCLRHFPEVYTSQTINRKAQYNLEEIRQVMPTSLEDLSALPMDLEDEFTKLLTVISPIEKINGEANPYYLSPGAIDPEWRGTGAPSEVASFYVRIRTNTTHYIKTLEKKTYFSNPLGWPMYDENQADLVNSLKHIVINVKKQLNGDAENAANPEGALISFGIVLNSLFHCPTGQAEGIESAVNLIVRSKHTTSTDLKEKIGRFIIASAVQKAFNNAFFKEGHVHALARARMVLKEELGLVQAIRSFRERIEPVSKAEEPIFHNTFYGKFDLEFILKEVRRNLQTPAEFDKILNARTTEEHKQANQIKREKPVNVSEISTWLYDQGKSDNFLDIYGISDDFQSISDAGIIRLLIDMHFLTDCPKTQRLLGRMDQHTQQLSTLD